MKYTWVIFCLFSFPLVFAQDDLTKREKKEIFRLYQDDAHTELLELPDQMALPDGFLLNGDKIYLVERQGELAGYLLSTSAKGRYEYFDYTVFFSADLLVQGILITVYRSTHGAAICQTKWLKQFIGYKGEEITVGNEIDAISGATFSVTSLVKDIQRGHHLMTVLQADGTIE